MLVYCCYKVNFFKLITISIVINLNSVKKILAECGIAVSETPSDMGKTLVGML